MTPRLTRGLLRLYPGWWRERYGDEFSALLVDLPDRGWRRRLWEVHDVVRAAVSARLERRSLMNPAVRRGVYDGLIISGLLAIVIVLTNVVFPGGPDESDADPEYVVQLLATFGVIALLFAVVGARGRRRLDRPWAGLGAGVAAGVVVAVMVTLTFLAVNNAFFDIVSQQHDKRVAFAASGWTSMRAYVSVTQVMGLVGLVPMLAVVGGLLGLLGGLVVRRRPA